MQITRFGHAALLVESPARRILIDPGTFSPDATFALRDLDAILVTHQHADHVDLDRVGRLVGANSGAALWAEPQVAAQLRDIGGDWSDLFSEGALTVGDIEVTGVGGRHAVIHPDLPRIGNVGVVLEADGTRLFHPGDTYEYTPERIDVLAVPLSAPWAKVSETVDFVRAVGPRVLIPIHDCTIAEAAYPMYWGRTAELGGVEDSRQLAQDGSTTA